MKIGKEAAEARVMLDALTGVIHVDASIFWAPEDLDSIMDRMAQFVRAAHARSEQALVLVNFGTTGAQSADTVQRVRRQSAMIYEPGDRLAIVLQSNVLKLQITRVERIAEYRIFPDAAEAVAWLLSPVTAAHTPE